MMEHGSAMPINTTVRARLKGVVQNLSAIALSIKPGGSAQLIEISGGLKTNGKDVFPLEQHGAVQRLAVDGGCGAHEDC
jgi:hypothetical protein